MNHCHYLITNCPSKLIGSEVGLFQPVWILMIPPLTCKPGPSEFEKFDVFFPNRYQSQILQTFEKVPLFYSQSPHFKTVS